MIRSLINLYRGGGVVGVYRYAAAWFHVGMAHLLDRWARWHSHMAMLIVEDEVGPCDEG